MFVNDLSFFVTMSRDIKMVSVEFLPSRTAEQLRSSITKVIYIYRQGGYMVHNCLMDMQFEPLVNCIDEVIVNTIATRTCWGYSANDQSDKRTWMMNCQ